MKLMKTRESQKQKGNKAPNGKTTGYRVSPHVERDERRHPDKREGNNAPDYPEREVDQSLESKASGSVKEQTPSRESSARRNGANEQFIRLNKYLAECGVASRRRADELISEGRVTVNGSVVNVAGSKINPLTDRVLVNRRPVRPQPKGMLLLHKPKGVVTTMSDPEGRRCVADYLSKRYRGYYPAGRLDWDSSGLVILTNDGEVADALMHPRYGAQRTYHVRVEGGVSESVCQRLLKGVILEDGLVKVDSISIIDGEGRRSKTQTSRSGSMRLRTPEEGEDQESTRTWLEISIYEGRNRIVRRLFDFVGHPVVKLKRVSHGPCKLGSLPPGQIRALTEREFQEIRRRLSLTSAGRLKKNNGNFRKARSNP
jgi:23S rRNA pseudouridine2605 synthase